LLALVEPDVRGDPVSPLRWTTKSARKLADELRAPGWRISADTVAGLLRAEGFSLQANAKTVEGKQHPDRTRSSVTSTNSSRTIGPPTTRSSAWTRYANLRMRCLMWTPPSCRLTREVLAV
jgi:hypothetical protein